MGMGVLPLVFKPGENGESLGLLGKEKLTVAGISGTLPPRQNLRVEVEGANGRRSSFSLALRLDTKVEIDYNRNGGILHTVLRKMLIT